MFNYTINKSGSKTSLNLNKIAALQVPPFLRIGVGKQAKIRAYEQHLVKQFENNPDFINLLATIVRQFQNEECLNLVIKKDEFYVAQAVADLITANYDVLIAISHYHSMPNDKPEQQTEQAGQEMIDIPNNILEKMKQQIRDGEGDIQEIEINPDELNVIELKEEDIKKVQIEGEMMPYSEETMIDITPNEKD